MEFVEEIENNICTNFKVTKIPVRTLKQFKRYCEEECGDVYAVGIFQLLKTKKQYEDLIPLMKHLQEEIDEIKVQTKSKEIKTFG